jgi:hypothetical protein
MKPIDMKVLVTARDIIHFTPGSRRKVPNRNNYEQRCSLRDAITDPNENGKNQVLEAMMAAAPFGLYISLVRLHFVGNRAHRLNLSMYGTAEKVVAFPTGLWHDIHPVEFPSVFDLLQEALSTPAMGLRSPAPGNRS